MTFDFSKKNEKDLILIKRVQIRLHGKYVTYFMTNDFSYVLMVTPPLFST